MAKTMINIKPVKSNSEHHNFRNEAVSNRRITKSEIDGIDFHKTTKTGIGDFKTDYVRTGDISGINPLRSHCLQSLYILFE